MDRFRCEVVAISRAISTAQTQPTPMDIGALSKRTPSKGGKGAKGGENRNNQMSQECPRCGSTDHASANCPHSDKTRPSACRSSGTSHPRQREVVRRAMEARVQAQSKRVESEDRTPHHAHRRRTFFSCRAHLITQRTCVGSRASRLKRVACCSPRHSQKSLHRLMSHRNLLGLAGDGIKCKLRRFWFVRNG